MTNYHKGRRLEYAARQYLEAQGYTVLRSAGSKGPVDLTAINKYTIRLIQVKARGAMRPAHLARLRQLLPLPKAATLEVWTPGQLGGWEITRVG